MADIKRYYYCEDGETAVGPFSREKFQELLAKEVVNWEVWVTREDDAEWRTAAEFDEFKDFEALVASGRAGQNYESVLEAGFFSTEEDERRAQDLQNLQRAASRIDLSRFREAATDREEVPTGEKPSALWFLPYLRLKYAFILIGFAALLGLVIVLTHGGGKKPATVDQGKNSANVLAEGGPMGGGEDRPASSSPVIKVPAEGTPPIGEKLADSRVSIRDSPALPANFYQLSRPHEIRVDNELLAMKTGTRVRVIDRQPDMWTVEADDVRFQVSPTDLRRENSEGVSTVGTPAARSADGSESAALDATSPRPAGSGVPPAAIPAFGE